MGQLYSEQTAQRLEELYRSYGYIQYKMSKFEPYDLYLRNKNFLVSKDILTFTDGDGRLMALKPDVTLSIVKNARGGEGLQKVYYRENVYRTSPMGRGFREIMQTGLECVGEIDLTAMGEVLRLAAESLAAIGEDYLLDLSHLGFAAGLLDSGGVEEGREELLSGHYPGHPGPVQGAEGGGGYSGLPEPSGRAVRSPWGAAAPAVGDGPKPADGPGPGGAAPAVRSAGA